MTARVIITGDKEIDRRLSQVEAKVARQLQRKAMRQAAKVVQAEAARRAPRDTGYLAKTMKVRAIRRSRQRFGVQVMSQFRGKRYYGAYVEYGTADTPAKPFMRPAMEVKRTDVNRIFITELKAGMRGL